MPHVLRVSATSYGAGYFQQTPGQEFRSHRRSSIGAGAVAEVSVRTICCLFKFTSVSCSSCLGFLFVCVNGALLGRVGNTQGP